LRLTETLVTKILHAKNGLGITVLKQTTIDLLTVSYKLLFLIYIIFMKIQKKRMGIGTVT
jgi:hypothetical protein